MYKKKDYWKRIINRKKRIYLISGYHPNEHNAFQILKKVLSILQSTFQEFDFIEINIPFYYSFQHNAEIILGHLSDIQLETMRFCANDYVRQVKRLSPRYHPRIQDEDDYHIDSKDVIIEFHNTDPYLFQEKFGESNFSRGYAIAPLPEDYITWTQNHYYIEIPAHYRLRELNVKLLDYNYSTMI